MRGLHRQDFCQVADVCGVGEQGNAASAIRCMPITGASSACFPKKSRTCVQWSLHARVTEACASQAVLT